MRHHGIDIFNLANETIAIRHDGVKGVGWLTIVDDRFVKELGGPKKIREALPESVEILAVKGGLLFKAGPRPKFGDTNRRDRLPEYKAVYKLVKPLAERATERCPALTLGEVDSKDRTHSWLRRFDDA